MKRKASPKKSDSLNQTWSTKVSVEEGQELEPKILHFAKGNRAEYIRAALLNYKPKKGDFQ